MHKGKEADEMANMEKRDDKTKEIIDKSIETVTDPESTTEERNQAYNEYVKQVTPTHNLGVNMAKAFVLGGGICLIGQIITNIAKYNFGLDKQEAAAWCSMILVLCSIVLTSLNWYPSLANWGGAGALVPITGFANGVAAPAIEFKKEGQVFGIGVKIFTIAGPVILYGIFSSWLLGLIYWIIK